MRTNLFGNIEQLQLGQHQHDVAAHSDIANALLPKRLTHFTLHFSKYLGAMTRAHRTNDATVLHRAIVDSLIIALAAANAMNVRLKDHLSGSPAEPAPSVSDPTFIQHAISSYAEIVGEMAKACEVLDHVEAYPSRQVLESSVISLVALIDRISVVLGIDLPSAVRDRWAGIERKWSPGRADLRPNVKLSAVA